MMRKVLIKSCPFGKPDLALHFGGCSIWESFKQESSAPQYRVYNLAPKKTVPRRKDVFDLVNC